MTNLNDRHPSTLHMLKVLVANPKLPSIELGIATNIEAMAHNLVHHIKDGPELTAGLRKLLEAKDCFIRASLDLDPVDYRDR